MPFNFLTQTKKQREPQNHAMYVGHLTRGPKSLHGIEALKGLTPSALQVLADCCQWRDVEPGQVIFRPEDSLRDVCFLVSGEALVAVQKATGLGVELSPLHAGEMFGELSAIDGSPRTVTVTTQSVCQLAFLPRYEFRALLEREHSVMYATFSNLSKTIRALVARCYELSVVDTPGRLLSELLRIALDGELSGDASLVSKMPTRTELAKRIASDRDTVSRQLRRLELQGVIALSGNSLRVLSISQLDGMVREAMGDVGDQPSATPQMRTVKRRARSRRTPRSDDSSS